ncbi:unnamed protein product [Oikopleura dioica]|uniref:Uncharacterized protein n=1 Tax=Oikopleura dioica TaxID=34765 RepID=E4XBK3_OIKDI|nr:unnamed protein product [Oikopleura dioica]CBY34387.1 unnamed protein product [Oikopleura dioica]
MNVHLVHANCYNANSFYSHSFSFNLYLPKTRGTSKATSHLSRRASTLLFRKRCNQFRGHHRKMRFGQMALKRTFAFVDGESKGHYFN